MKINNEKLWQDFVKTGKLTGFSIEGLFSHQLVEAASERYLLKEIDELSEVEAELVLSKIRTMFESYSDYSEGIRNNAKRGIELNEKNGNKCATQTGKVRAQAIAGGEKLSVDVIKRMYSYLSRAETYYDNADETSDCGYISYLLWGGKAALGWSKNKLRELGLLEEAEEGVPHYTADGKLYEGPTHKDAEGRLMTGEVHSEDSEYLYHKEDLEAQPSVASTYPGQAVSGSSTPPILQDFNDRK